MLTHQSSHIIEANGSTEIQIFPVKEKIMYVHKIQILALDSHGKDVSHLVEILNCVVDIGAPVFINYDGQCVSSKRGVVKMFSEESLLNEFCSISKRSMFRLNLKNLFHQKVKILIKLILMNEEEQRFNGKKQHMLLSSLSIGKKEESIFTITADRAGVFNCEKIQMLAYDYAGEDKSHMVDLIDLRVKGIPILNWFYPDYNENIVPIYLYSKLSSLDMKFGSDTNNGLKISLKNNDDENLIVRILMIGTPCYDSGF
jgi:hypothetical protein